MTTTHPLASTALAEARTWKIPFVLYRDPELGGYGAYTKAQLETVGAWCRPYIVLDSEKLGTPWADCLRELDLFARTTGKRSIGIATPSGWNWLPWEHGHLPPNTALAWDSDATQEQNAQLLIRAAKWMEENYTERTAI